LPHAEAAEEGSERWTIVGTGAHLDQVNVLHELRMLPVKELTIEESLRLVSSPGRPINKGDSGGGLFRGEGPYELLGVLSGSMDYRARWTYLPAYSKLIGETMESRP
jgi:hypothetical protein